MNRRRFLRYAGATAVAVGASAIGLESLTNFCKSESVPPVTVTTTNTVTETTTNVVTPAWIASLRAAAESRGLFVGAAAFPGPKPLNWYGGQGLLDREYAGTLSGEFNFLTPEDAMDWSKIEMYGFGPADALVDFAIANRMKVRGHTLVYGYKNELPLRINEQMSSDQLRLAVQDHIRSEVGHFKGKVYDWTVVNEAVGNQDGLRQTIFLEKLGEGYIAEAFKIAHEADPDALLLYNDYGAEAVNSDYNNKSDRVYALIKKLLAEGVPIGGVGLQMHIDAWDYPDPSLVAENVRRLCGLGLEGLRY